MLDKIQPKTFGFIVELMSNKGKSSRGRKKSDFEKAQQTSSVVQWLGINLPTQGTQVRSLVQEDPACLGATMPVNRTFLELVLHNERSPLLPQLEKAYT